MRQRAIIMVVLAAGLVTACSRATGSAGAVAQTSPSGPSASAASATASAPAPTATPDATVDPELAQAVRFRHDFGLRDDVAFVAASMTDPTASVEPFGVALYPDEIAKLFADQADQNATIPIVVGYATAHAGEYGGVYIDRDQHPGIVTTLWTGHLDQHATVLAGLLGGHAVMVRQVAYTYAELDALKDQVFADIDWMEGIPARATSIGVDIIENSVHLDVSSAQTTAVQQIVDHYGLGDKLVVTSDGTGVVFIPNGTVKGKIRTADGKIPRSIEDLNLGYEFDPAIPGECGSGDIGYPIKADGTFVYPCTAGVRTITITGHRANGANVEVGRAMVTVIAGKTVKVTIRLNEGR